MSRKHSDALRALMPVALGDAALADIELEGALLDEATASADVLLREMFPDAAVALLADWERVAGLPDPCTGALGTLQQRQSAVVERLRDKGGCSIPFFIAVAAALGYAVTIDEFTPFRCGASAAGDPVCDDEWAFVWQVNAAETAVTYFAAGASAAGEPLAAWGDAVLECVFGRRKPAHTYIIFAYGG